ncbi:hypothetical protein WAF17_02835 [Bernardetia sp. ABR2-2B]|uniref:hypothetical protein n=1 Tax=Bernardetia sp. ABR2-2B TaxID=3127472 RepID=UPI0030D54AF1
MSFKDGLNIVKGANTSGKSTVFQTMLYGLGMEELLGGRNEKTMQSALKDEVEFPKGEYNKIIQSRVFLEIQNNKKIITTQRYIVSKSSKISSKLIRVFKGGIITNGSKGIDFFDTWVHDSGAASNKKRGFYSILEDFLGWDLPDIYYSTGELRKLYIQTIFPSFLIEQKGGWSDFLARIPYYGIRNADSRAIEFLLKLDTFEKSRQKQELRQQKEDLKDRWESTYRSLKYATVSADISIKGITKDPEIIDDKTPISFFLYSLNKKRNESEKITLDEYISKLNKEYKDTDKNIKKTPKVDVTKTEKLLSEKELDLSKLNISWSMLSKRLTASRNNLKNSEIRLNEKEEELRQNQDAKKIVSLGGHIDLDTADDTCPYCKQHIKDNLFVHNSGIEPLSIEETIKYLRSQLKMIQVYIENEKRAVNQNERLANSFNNEMNELRKEIRALKSDLTANDKAHSEAMLEKKILLKSKLTLYYSTKDKINDLVLELESLSLEWKELLVKESKLPKNNLSPQDNSKISDVQKIFITLLKRFGYTSKSDNSIIISKDSDKRFLLPVIKEQGGFNYNLKFDSSGSDFIRSLWAFYCALYKISGEYNTNHPKILIFDEPIQQDTSNKSVNALIRELSTYKEGQSIIFASFHQKEEAYKEMTEGVTVTDFNLIQVGSKSIIPE